MRFIGLFGAEGQGGFNNRKRVFIPTQSGQDLYLEDFGMLKPNMRSNAIITKKAY